MNNKTQLPENETIATAMILQQAKEPGFVGRIFGTKEHAPTNIIATVLILFFILLFISLFATLPADVNRGTLSSSVFSAISFTLGLLFGRSGGLK